MATLSALPMASLRFIVSEYNVELAPAGRPILGSAPSADSSLRILRTERSRFSLRRSRRADRGRASLLRSLRRPWPHFEHRLASSPVRRLSISSPGAVLRRRLGLQQRAGALGVLSAVPVAHQPEVSDANEALWQHILEESADELLRTQAAVPRRPPALSGRPPWSPEYASTIPTAGSSDPYDEDLLHGHKISTPAHREPSGSNPGIIQGHLQEIHQPDFRSPALEV